MDYFYVCQSIISTIIGMLDDKKASLSDSILRQFKFFAANQRKVYIGDFFTLPSIRESKARTSQSGIFPARMHRISSKYFSLRSIIAFRYIKASIWPWRFSMPL